MKRPHYKTHRAFTLMELLVVIAILGILAALLLPALSKARPHAWSVTCLANQKQLVAAWMMYADEHNGRIPRSTCHSSDSWRIQATEVTNVPPPGLDPLATAIWQAQEGYKQGALYSYAQDPKIIHCPGDPRPRPATSFDDPGYDSYSIPEGLNSVSSRYQPILKHSEIAHTSARYVFVEEFDPRGDNKSSWQLVDTGPLADYQGSSWIDSPAVFHGRSSSFAWADGHASNRRWVEIDTVKFAASRDWTKFNHDPDPPDNADIIFIATGFPFLRDDGGNP